MFDRFKTDKENPAQDVKLIRDHLLQFIKERLQHMEGGEGAFIKTIQLFVACTEGQKHIYESAVYINDEQKLKNEIQKIADDYAIDLPPNWALQISFVTELPTEVLPVPNTQAGLFIQTRKQTLNKAITAYITVLNGEAEQEHYTLHSNDRPVNIGREKKVQTPDGFMRINNIAFPASSQHESNQFVSRQHAHIAYDNETGNFLLFPDEGGLPPRNKIKVRSVGGAPVKLQSAVVGHPLQDGDQIILGETALLQFNIENPEKS